MATFKIVKEDTDYITVEVKFDDQTFEQVVVAGADLQAYADQYETDWLALQAAD
jgi:hypothetical protein